MNLAQPQLCLSFPILSHRLYGLFWQKEMQDFKFFDHNSVFWNTNIHYLIILPKYKTIDTITEYICLMLIVALKSLVLYPACEKYLPKTNQTA